MTRTRVGSASRSRQPPRSIIGWSSGAIPRPRNTKHGMATCVSPYLQPILLNVCQGVLAVTTKATLYDSEGKIIGVGKRDPPYSEGRPMFVGGKDIELDRSITRAEFLSGTCFGDSMAYSSVQTASTSKPTALNKQFVPLKIGPSHQPSSASERKIVPLQPVDLLSTVSNNSPKKALPSIKGEVRDSYWTANWRKTGQNRKHKTWDGDAFVSNVGGKMTMVTEEGKMCVYRLCLWLRSLTRPSMGTTAWKGDILHGGYHLYIGGKEVELDCEVTLEDLPSVAGGHADEKPAPAVENSAGVSTGSPATGVKSFVAPTSFYGPQVPSKPKPKGPL